MIDITADPIFKAWQGSLKTSTGNTYRQGLIEYCNFTNRTPYQLIEEAREDYLNRVAPWEVRHVKMIESFALFLKTKDSANWTKLTRINAIKNFYFFNKIPVFVNNNYISHTATEEYLDLPLLKMEDIRRFVLTCGTKSMTKALILTFISSGQAQAEVLKLQGRHLKNIVNGVAVVNMTRGKTSQRYSFFISGEAIDSIKEYKGIKDLKDFKDDEYIFSQKNDRQLYPQIVGGLFSRHAEKLGFNRAYFSPHRARHFFKTTLTGLIDSVFIEYWMGHKPRGTDANYFIGASIQERMLDAYIKNLDKLTVFTDKEVLQKQYDDLKNKHDTETETIRKGYEELKKQMELLTAYWKVPK